MQGLLELSVFANKLAGGEEVMDKKNSVVMLYHDHQRRTCIQVERINGHVKYIPLDVSTGLEVRKTSTESFDQRFTPTEGYPAEKACQLYLSYSQNIGATKEALNYLGQIINVSKQELEMATTKKVAAAEKTAAKAKPTEVVKTPAKTGEKKQSAAQMFQDLIMEGKLTDDKIFEKVQEKFGLDEKKRGYTKWYRNHLKKLGANPPEAKVAK